MRTGWLKRPDCSIYYEVAGEGPPLVFAHGLGGNHLSWWQQVAHFKNRFTCVVFAHRGFTPSSPVPGHTAPEHYADDLAALLKELSIDSARLVAQSMGGWTCMEFALREPEKVQALVMASTSGALDFHRLRDPSPAAIKAWESQAAATIADWDARDVSSASGERMLQEQPALAMLYRQITQLTPLEFRSAVRPRIRQMRVQPPERLAALPVPVLFVTGDEDVLFPSIAGPGFAALASKGRAVRVPKSGHSVYFERAAEFNRIVEEFLQ